MKVFLNIVLLLAVTLSAACATAPQQEPTAADPEVSARGPLEGVWSITEAIVTSADGTSTVAESWLRLRPGSRAAMPLGMLGEMGLEAG